MCVGAVKKLQARRAETELFNRLTVTERGDAGGRPGECFTAPRMHVTPPHVSDNSVLSQSAAVEQCR